MKYLTNGSELIWILRVGRQGMNVSPLLSCGVPFFGSPFTISQASISMQAYESVINIWTSSYHVKTDDITKDFIAYVLICTSKYYLIFLLFLLMAAWTDDIIVIKFCK